MAFKRAAGSTAPPKDPESLYRMLALTNKGPEALWLHQGDVLRSWHGRHTKDPDVAIELPTGSGKTLVGGLIGEYQRRADGDRVAYLCPTRQLARQTADKLTEYGIPNVLLIGPSNEWNAADHSRYTSAKALAVSVYSHVFNSNPALHDAQLLLLDDAHAADGYVAKPWSLEITREQTSAYHAVLSALDVALDPLVLTRLRNEDPEGEYLTTVYLASPLGVTAAASQLEEALVAAAAAKTISKQARFALKFVRDHIDQCLVYLSYRRLLIRPLIPPTSVHPAFEQPARRVYMSATLGAGGELERIFGRRTVTRIPIPDGWEKQGTGRKLFAFPQLTADLAANPNSVDGWVARVIAEHGRAVVLTPDKRTADTFVSSRIPEGHEVLGADDVEDDLTVFTGKAAAALVLTNRYDGIDLPDNDCRLVVIDGLPAQGDLQERFLHDSLGAMEVLQERVRARIMQGAGRATRNARDFATVLILSKKLISYLTRGDVQRAMHPEIHAELEFGYDNSIDITSADMLEQLRVFVVHDSEWQAVDSDIVAARERYERIDPPGTEELQKAAHFEVAACDAMWQGEWSRALDLIRQVLDALRGGRAPSRYAALWNYLAFCVAHRLAAQNRDQQLAIDAQRYYEDARAAGRGTTWLSTLAAAAETAAAPAAPALDPLDELAMNTVKATAAQLARPAKFDPTVHAARIGLEGTPHREYEAGLVVMGALAGARPSEGDGGNTAAPDATWIFGDAIWVSWETKSEAHPNGELGADDVRQAGAHLRFAADKYNKAAPGDSIGLLMTPQQRVHPSARAIAEIHVYQVTPTQVLDIFDRLVRAWRTARGRGFEALSATDLADIFRAEQALPSQWIAALRITPLARTGS